MARLKSSIIVVLAVAVGGIAIAAPARQDRGNGAVRPGDPQLERVAFFRTTNVGECAEIQRRASAQTMRERDAKRARPDRRNTLATVGCNVVWTD
jgi:hypothetical protein